MPYKINFSDNPNGMTTLFSGILTDEEIIQSCKDRLAQEDKIRELFYIKDDLLDVTEFRVSSETIKTCASFALKASELNKQLVHVAIVPTDLVYGMARMWQAYSDGTNWNKNIFRSREEAEEWLKTNIQHT